VGGLPDLHRFEWMGSSNRSAGCYAASDESSVSISFYMFFYSFGAYPRVVAMFCDSLLPSEGFLTRQFELLP